MCSHRLGSAAPGQVRRLGRWGPRRYRGCWLEAEPATLLSADDVDAVVPALLAASHADEETGE